MSGFVDATFEAVLGDELARQQVLVHSLGVDLEYVYADLDDTDSSALEVDIEFVAQAATDVAGDLDDAWFSAFDDASETHVAYIETESTMSSTVRKLPYVIMAAMGAVVLVCIAL